MSIEEAAVDPCKVVFDALEWQEGLPGARFKAYGDGRKRMRLLELSAGFVEPDWCDKGHAGIVLAGELEIDFDGRVVRYGEGDGILIPAGASARHKARPLTPSVRLFLVEDAMD
jgi:quercetin dioxygenase-like cupin family protein